MRRMMFAFALLGVWALATTPADAFGKRSRRGGNDCGSPCATTSHCGANPCANVGCGQVTPCASAGPTYTEQKVTAYRPVYKQKTVPTEVTRLVSKTVEEQYSYTEVIPEWKAEKRNVTCYRPVTKEVPYTYTVIVPVITPQKRMQTFYNCVPEQITKEVPVCRTVSMQVVDPCSGCCRTVCQRVTEMQTISCTVMRSVPETREVTFNVCSYKPEKRNGTRMVCEMVPETREVTHNVCTYRAVEKTDTRHRVVCEPIKETVNVTHTYCEMEAYETTVQVPTGGLCYTAYHGGCGGHSDWRPSELRQPSSLWWWPAPLLPLDTTI